MLFGLTFDKVFIVAIVAVFLLGPERLPHYASQLAKLVKTVREMANGAKERMREEMGPDFDDVDWKKLDPRQYDPRRIIREALLEDEPVKPTSGSMAATTTTAAAAATATAADAAPVESAHAKRQRMLAEEKAAPFDVEST